MPASDLLTAALEEAQTRASAEGVVLSPAAVLRSVAQACRGTLETRWARTQAEDVERLKSLERLQAAQAGTSTSRRVHYLSMEFLMGRALHNALSALNLREGFALQPDWQGRTACTGPWARLHQGAPAQPWTAWALLGSRLAELVRLCLPDAPGEAGAGWLTWGSLASGPRQGLAWVEMARGLLIHQVTLDDAAPGVTPTVRACQVLAPTEWNFHPEGVAAQALASLPADAPDLHARVNLLMAALDPCVPFDIVVPTVHDHRMEAQHA